MNFREFKGIFQEKEKLRLHKTWVVSLFKSSSIPEDMNNFQNIILNSRLTSSD